MPITFDGKGALASALRSSGRKPSARPIQQTYANHVSKCFAKGHPAFIDAETGVGKTLGYLIPAIEFARSKKKSDRTLVVVSTATIALQKQLMAEDLPVAQAAVSLEYGVEMSCALRVGKGQIVDHVGVEHAFREFGSFDERVFADEVIEWCKEKVDGGDLPLRADLLEAFADQFKTLPRWLMQEMICLEPEHPSSDADTVALYSEALDRCDSADVLVVNHHLLALHMLRPFLWSDGRQVVIVVDEADRLPAVVEDINRSHVPLHCLRSALDAFSFGANGCKKTVSDLMDKISGKWDLAWTSSSSSGGVIPFSYLTAAELDELLVSMQVVSDSISGFVRNQKGRSGYHSPIEREKLATIDRYTISLDRVNRVARNGDLARTMIYYSPVRHYPGLATAREGAGRLIAKKLWGPDAAGDVQGALFTSATMSTLAYSNNTTPKRALSPFLKSCGFSPEEVQIESCAVFAPKRFGRMDFVRPPMEAPMAFVANGDVDPEGSVNTSVVSDKALSLWADIIGAAHGEGGRTLVLLPAARDVASLADRLDPSLTYKLVAQTPGFHTLAAISRFLDRDDSIWLSASAWEGVSLPNAISNLVIPRLPLRPPSLEDSVVEKYLADLTGNDQAGSGIVFARRLADLRRRLRQGIGRGIRSHDDAVKVWIADPRWPIPQRETDELFLDQPRKYSSTLVNAVPERFRKNLANSGRFQWVNA